MTNYEKLVEKLKEVEEIKKDLEELRFGTEVRYGDNKNVRHFHIGEGDFGGVLLWLKTSVEGYKDCSTELEEGEKFEIIGNPLEERHLRMYCAEYNIRCTFKNIFFEEEEKSASLLFLKGKQIVELDNTKPFHLQDDKVYGEILNYLNNI